MEALIINPVVKRNEAVDLVLVRIRTIFETMRVNKIAIMIRHKKLEIFKKKIQTNNISIFKTIRIACTRSAWCDRGIFNVTLF